MYPIVSLDLYFYSQEDALSFLDALKRVPSIGALNIKDAPPPPADMNPVIQQLEQAAISPQYGHRGSSSTVGSLPPPPAASPPSMSGPVRQQSLVDNAAPPAMAYNPAAPSAPEPIRPREKTPPPIDADTGTGLTAAAVQDYQIQQPGLQYQQRPSALSAQMYGPGSLQRQSTAPATSPPPLSSNPSFSSTIPQVGSGVSTPTGEMPLQRTSTFPLPQPPSGARGFSSSPTPPMQAIQQPLPFSPPPTQTTFNPGPSSSPGQGQARPGQSPGQAMSFAPPPAQESMAFSPPPGAQAAASPPPGGYSTYSYNQNQTSQHAPHEIHQQMYRPTEAEAAIVSKKKKQQAAKPGGKVDQVEKGINRFLKKLDGM